MLTGAEYRIQVVLHAQAPISAPEELRFLLEAHANIPGILQKIELFNYQTEAWEQVDLRPAATTDTVVEVVITTNAPASFIRTRGFCRRR